MMLMLLLQETVVRVMDEQVTGVARTACAGLEDIATKRKDEVDVLEDEVDMLESELRKGAGL